MRAARMWLIPVVIASFLLQAAVVAGAPPERPLDAAYQQTFQDYQAGLALTEKDARAERLRQCIRRLEELLRRDTGKTISDKCRYLVGRAHHRLYDDGGNPSDFTNAIENYQKLIQQFPHSTLADDAQYLTGILYTHKDPSQAYLELMKVGILFPQGDMRSKADAKVRQLADQLKCSPGSPLSETPPRAATRNVQTSTEAALNSAAKGKTRIVDPPKAKNAVQTCDPVSRLKDVQHWSGPDYTRVVLYTTTPVNHQAQGWAAGSGKQQPARIVVHLEPCTIDPRLKPVVRPADQLLQKIRLEKDGENRVLVEIESSGIESYRIFSMSDPFRLVVDVRGKKREVPQQQPSRTATRPEKAVRPDNKDPLPSLARQLGLEIKRIVVDPGHGGKDKGAIGPNNTFEKDIVLAIARQLKPLLEARTGCEVILTRTKDVYLSLEERTAIANTNRADLFVSIHANAHPDRTKQGVETYFLNLAKDQESARVAALENATSTRKISDLESILKDLMLNTKVDESARLAAQVQSNLVSRLKTDYESVRDLGTKQAPFYVLMGAEMPSILIETSFISNPVEEEKLKDKRFQKCLAESICSGILSYMEGMRTAAWSGGRP